MAEKAALPRQFNKIILTLENCLLPEDKLQETPSQQDGLDKQTETDLRILGCELVQTAGLLLKLPQVNIIKNSTLCASFDSNITNFFACIGGNGYGTNSISTLLLFQIVCPPQYGNNRNELYMPRIKNRRSTTTDT